ncbi:hypothetical protein JHD48_01550 [Sulfurimonas sp. SAG-AH-194-I05]|nr:hypothetical protein [Sulfurimonas sp. SAG-AH-194-I05]MDF1874412.1 hypothetical protein [Sulfurimonas sp. SAG-AH-194-I05]
MKEENLDQEEKEIVEYIENSNVKSVDNLSDEILRYSNLAKNHISKKKAISIRLAESDLYLLKQKALSTGVSYQNLIQTLIHQYTHEKIKIAL